MPRQPFRFATGGGHSVYVCVTGVLTTEGDSQSIGREMRVRCLTLKAGEPSRRPALTVDDPDIIRVSKGDGLRADGRSSQKPCAGSGFENSGRDRQGG